MSALGSPRFADREQAQRAITARLVADKALGLTPRDLPALYAGTHSPDPEVRVRCEAMMRFASWYYDHIYYNTYGEIISVYRDE